MGGGKVNSFCLGQRSFNTKIDGAAPIFHIEFIAGLQNIALIQGLKAHLFGPLFEISGAAALSLAVFHKLHVACGAFKNCGNLFLVFIDLCYCNAFNSVLSSAT